MQIYNSFPKYLRFAFHKKAYWDFLIRFVAYSNGLSIRLSFPPG